MNVTAVVLNWKRADDTIACARSVRDTSPDTRIIVVDNASGDGSVEKVRAAFPDVTIIENGANLGYAGGNNVGIEAAMEDPKTDAVLVLNNDVVLRPGCIEALAGALASSGDVAIATPVSLTMDDPPRLDFFETGVDLRWMATSVPGRGEPWHGADLPRDIGYAPGNALMIDAGHLRSAGDGHPAELLFDERFFLVWEDVDISLRALARHDVILAVPTAVVLHAGSASFGGEGSPLYQYFYVRNSFLIVDKHVSRWRKRRTRALLERRYRGWLDKPETTAGVRRAIELGLEHGLAGRWGPPPDEVRAL